MNCAENKTREMLEWVLPDLMKTDFRDTSTKVLFSFYSLLLCVFIYVSSACLSSLIEKYRQLILREKVFWNLAIVRAFYGIFFTVIGAWGVFVAKHLDCDIVFGRSQTSHFAVTMTTGFFVFESFALALFDVIFGSFNFLLHLHHCICLIYSYLVLMSDVSHPIFVKGLLLESSTPLSAASWMLLKCRMERSLIWKINQFVLVHIFHCRNIVEIYIIYIIYQNWPYLWSSMPPAILIIICIITPAIACVLTPFWTYKKTVQMVTPYDFNFEKIIPKPDIAERNNKRE
ncbi:protein CLN8-like [Gigantopelta aegis]|uniref:protein CLN8-like n=1 Tax=Gigantopelta aegis TaxID=1735272 RepID=UPI001B88C031|nr:protein CLN8-like [Gigantopelta aegis]